VKEEVRQRLDKARALRDEVAGLTPDQQPSLMMEGLYYALFHAACAAVAARSGSIPRTHASVIGQFGKIVRDESEAARSAGRLLNAAAEWRLAAIYDTAASSNVEGIEELYAALPAFLDLCEAPALSGAAPHDT